MGKADGLDDGQDNSALHIVASIVLAVGLAGADVEVGEVAAVSGPDGQCEPGEEGGSPTRGLLVFQSGRGFAGAREGYHLGSERVRRVIVPVTGILDIQRWGGGGDRWIKGSWMG